MKINFNSITPLEELNFYRAKGFINLTQYKQALSYLNKGYHYRFIIDILTVPNKVKKVIKGNKLKSIK
ncbi:MAG: hypothetical protein FJY17_00635 [Bacteroidetes bacterium]|nr:hypothetical protein [Bacteroidota bacterium]